MEKEALKQIEKTGVKVEVIGTLLDMREGRVVADINMKWAELVAAVLATGHKGKMQINLMISPGKRGFGGSVDEVKLVHEVKLSKPESKVGESTFFVTDKGGLSRDHPDQVSIFDDKANLPAADGKSAGGN